ncbi:MAG: prepilin-type N-terminal cleavage/methylation domain-containing protein [gamma proteobacterium symbiont of Phacoides pectinatus]
MFRPNASPGVQRGVTLIELISTLAIAAILLTLAVPGFSRWSEESRLVTEVNTLLTHLHLARSEAVKQRTPVVLCPDNGQGDCAATIEWQAGYILFPDLDGDRRRGPDEPLLRRYRPDAGGPRIRSARSTRGRKRTLTAMESEAKAVSPR